MDKRLMVSSGIQFDSINKLKKEAQAILDSVSKQINLKVSNVDISNLDKSIEKINKKISSMNNTKIDIDGLSSAKSLEELAKTLREIQGLSKYKVELMSDGQKRVVTDVNNELKETIRTVKNLSTGGTNISISGNLDKNKKDIYNEIIKLQKTEYELKTKLLTADGEYAKVLQEQLNYTQQISRESIENVNKTNLSDETLYNNLLKERSILENKLNAEKSKINTNNFNKTNQDLMRQNDYLDKVIAKLRIYQQAVNNKGGGKPTEQTELNNEISRQISKMEELKKQNNVLGTAEKNRINSTVSQMRVQTNELVKYESSFSNLFKRMGMYAFGGSIIYTAISEVKKGINDIVSLDTAMRDLTKVAKATQEQLDGFTSVANKMAKEVGTSTENIIKATEYYSKLGYAIDEATKRSREAVIFKNVGDFQSIDEASKALITISKGFDLNTLEDMTRIMDVANNTGNKFSSSTKDVADGLQKMGNALYEAGNTYEQAVGIFVAGNASIQDADVTGTALKTIAMRLRGMETEIDETSIPVSKLRDEIKQLTASAGQMVDIMVDDNTFKSTYEQMTELAQVYPKLTDGQRAYLQYVIAGQRQGNIFSGTMKNMQEGIEAYNSALESSGSAYEEQERFMDSIEGKMNQFSETLKSIWVSAISSDTIKNIVDFGTVSLDVFGKMANTFGGLPATIGVATAGLVLFNKEMYMGMTKNMPLIGGISLKIDNLAKVTQMSVGRVISGAFNKFADSMTSAGAKATVLSAKNTALAVSFKAVEVASALATATMTLGLSLAITSIITGVSKLIDKLIVTKEELREMNEESTRFVTESSKSIAQAQKLLGEKMRLDNQIKDTTDINKRKELESQLVEVEKELASVLPQSSTGFDEQGVAISSNNTLIAEQIRLKKEQMEIESLGFIQSNRNLQSELDGLEQKKKQYEDMKLAMLKGEDYTKQITYTERGQTTTGTYSQKVTQGDLDKLNKEIENVTLKASQAQVHIKWLLSNGYSASEIASMGFKTDVVENYIKSVNDSTKSIKDNTRAKQENANESFGETSIQEATKNYGEAVGKVNELDTLLQKINKEQQLTPDIVLELSKNYSELGAGITDVGEVQKYLNDEINKQVAIQQEAYQIMVGDDQKYYDEKIRNSNEAQNIFNKLASQFVDVNSGGYNFDLKNFKTLNEAKVGFMNQLSKPLSQFLANLVGGSAEAYENDLSNSKNWASAKAKILAKLDEQISKIENRMVQAFTNSATSADALGQEKFAKNALAQLDKLTSAKADIDTAFNEFYANFNTSTPTFGQGSSTIGGSNKNTEKEVGDLEDLTNRYHDLEDAVNDYSNALKINKLLQENSTGANKINLMKEELGLYQKQAEAVKKLNEEQRREANELKSILANQGVSFDNKGDISNYNAILTSKRNWANSLSGDAKESAKEQVKALAEQLKRYDELVNKLIPSQEDEWQSLNNTIKEVYKTQAKLVSDQEKQIYDTVKYFAERATETKKKEIDKQIELLNKSYDDESKDEDLNKQRQKVTELMNEMAKYENSVDAKGKARYQQLVSEYEAQQSELNNIIKESQKELMLSSMEKEKEKLDEELEDLLSPANMNKLIADALNSGMVEIGGEVVDLQKAMTSMLSETTIGTQTLIQTNNEWINSLKEAISLYSNISGINSNIGLNTSINGLSGARGVDSRTFNINVSVPKMADGVTGDDVSKAITKALKEYDSKFK